MCWWTYVCYGIFPLKHPCIEVITNICAKWPFCTWSYVVGSLPLIDMCLLWDVHSKTFMHWCPWPLLSNIYVCGDLLALQHLCKGLHHYYSSFSSSTSFWQICQLCVKWKQKKISCHSGHRTQASCTGDRYYTDWANWSFAEGLNVLNPYMSCSIDFSWINQIQMSIGEPTTVNLKIPNSTLAKIAQSVWSL